MAKTMRSKKDQTETRDLTWKTQHEREKPLAQHNKQFHYDRQVARAETPTGSRPVRHYIICPLGSPFGQVAGVTERIRALPAEPCIDDCWIEEQSTLEQYERARTVRLRLAACACTRSKGKVCNERAWSADLAHVPCACQSPTNSAWRGSGECSRGSARFARHRCARSSKPPVPRAVAGTWERGGWRRLPGGR